MSEKELLEMKEKVDRIFEMLGGVLIEADTLTKIHGLNENTISRNEKLEKFQEIGRRKILLKLESVPVVKSLKRAKKKPKS